MIGLNSLAMIFHSSGQQAEATKLKLNIEVPGIGMTLKELPFSDDITLGVLKQKLMMKSGTDPANMVGPRPLI